MKPILFLLTLIFAVIGWCLRKIDRPIQFALGCWELLLHRHELANAKTTTEIFDPSAQPGFVPGGKVLFLGVVPPDEYGNAFTPDPEQDKRIMTEAGKAMTFEGDQLKPVDLVRTIAIGLKTYDYKIMGAKSITSTGIDGGPPEGKKGYEVMTKVGDSIRMVQVFPDWKANSGLASEAFDGDAVLECPVVGTALMANEAKGEDNWVVIATPGNHPNKGGLQIVTKESLQQVANEFNNWSEAPRRALGLPIYVGHPDHPDFKTVYTDRTAVGRIKGLRVNEAGELEMKPKWSTRGKQLVNEEQMPYPSVNWFVRNVKGGVSPVRLKSLGLTNEPCFHDVNPILRANEKQADGWAEVATCLALANDATPAVCVAAIKTLQSSIAAHEPALNAIANERTEAKTALTAAQEAVKTSETTLANQKATITSLETAINALTKERDEAKTLFANERKARATDKLIVLVKTGKVKGHERDKALTELCNSFDTASAIYDGRQPMHTDSVANEANLGQRNSNLRAMTGSKTERQEQFQTLVNQEMSKAAYRSLPADQAYNRACAAVTQSNPALFNQATA